MGLLDFGFGGGRHRLTRMELEEREERRALRRSMRKPKDEKEGPIYKILTNVAIVGLFVAAGILVAGIVSGGFNRWITLALLIVAILCLGLLLLLPWVRKIENKKTLPLAWTFVGFTCACVLLWVISAILIILIYDKVDHGTITDGFGIGCVIFFQIALIISLQFVLAQVVASTILRYQKKYIPFQVIMYLSYAFADFWLTCLTLCLQYNIATHEIDFVQGLWAFLASPPMYTMFSVALVYCLLSTAVINSIEKRRYYNARQDVTDAIERHAEMLNEQIEAQANGVAQAQAPQDDTKAKLGKLKEMLDEGLINEEEYNKKREEIINKF